MDLAKVCTAVGFGILFAFIYLWGPYLLKAAFSLWAQL